VTLGGSGIAVRLARYDDAALLWQWANDPIVRSNSFHSDPIPWEDHVRWFEARLRSESTRIWLGEDQGRPIGQVRYERDGDETEVAISVAPDQRGRGYASLLLTLTAPLACRSLGAAVLIAYILPDNGASAGAFAKAGYRRVGEIERFGRLALRCERVCEGPAA
jgi:RimJ/RimL family protein N-acetyltransferase